MVVAVVLGIASVVAVPIFIVPAALGAAGFGVTGIVAGSIAASVQGPAVVAGSAFAFLQSAGAGGVVAAAVVKGGAAVVAGGVAAVMGS